MSVSFAVARLSQVVVVVVHGKIMEEIERLHAVTLMSSKKGRTNERTKGNCYFFFVVVVQQELVCLSDGF